MKAVCRKSTLPSPSPLQRLERREKKSLPQTSPAKQTQMFIELVLYFILFFLIPKTEMPMISLCQGTYKHYVEKNTETSLQPCTLQVPLN